MTYKIVIPDDDQLFAAVLLGIEMWKESPVYRFMTKDIDLMHEYAEEAMLNKNSFVRVVLDDDEKCVGFMVGYLSKFGFAKETVARDQMLFIDPKHRSGGLASTMIKEFEKWSVDKGAKLVMLSASAGIDNEKTAALFNMLGYKTAGIITAKEMSDVL